VGKGREELLGTSPERHEVKTSLVKPVEVGIRGELRVKNEFVWYLTGPLLPLGDERENLVILLFVPKLPMRVAKPPGGGIVRQQGQHPLVAAAAFGNVRLLYEGILAVEWHGREVEIEGDPMWQAHRTRGIVPQAHEHRSTRRVDTATRRGQKGAFGHDVEAGKEGEAFVKDRAPDRAMARIAKAF